eukprot:gene31986-39515_t
MTVNPQYIAESGPNQFERQLRLLDSAGYFSVWFRVDNARPAVPKWVPQPSPTAIGMAAFVKSLCEELSWNIKSSTAGNQLLCSLWGAWLAAFGSQLFVWPIGMRNTKLKNKLRVSNSEKIPRLLSESEWTGALLSLTLDGDDSEALKSGVVRKIVQHFATNQAEMPSIDQSLQYDDLKTHFLGDKFVTLCENIEVWYDLEIARADAEKLALYESQSDQFDREDSYTPEEREAMEQRMKAMQERFDREDAEMKAILEVENSKAPVVRWEPQPALIAFEMAGYVNAVCKEMGWELNSPTAGNQLLCSLFGAWLATFGSQLFVWPYAPVPPESDKVNAQFKDNNTLRFVIERPRFLTDFEWTVMSVRDFLKSGVTDSVTCALVRKMICHFANNQGEMVCIGESLQCDDLVSHFRGDEYAGLCDDIRAWLIAELTRSNL